MGLTLDRALTIGDLRAMAQSRVPRMFFDYVESGSWTESTWKANATDLQAIRFRSRVGVPLEGGSLATTMTGQEVAMPVALAPTGLAGMLHPDGEICGARAAARFGVPFVLSTVSICPLEEVVRQAAGRVWFQLYMMRDPEFLENLIGRAEKAGCEALVLTMDLQARGQRHKDIRNGLSVPFRPGLRGLADMARHPRWSLGMALTRHRTFGNIVGHARDVTDIRSMAKWSASQFDRSLGWDKVRRLRERWCGQLILKGIMTAEDALNAADCGADAIVVSNHGGRQLDGAPSSIAVLPEIARAVAGRLEVHFDSGIQSGQDVLRALSLGARATYIGRAWLYGLAAGGESGVARALEIIRAELEMTLAFCGEMDIRAVGPQLLHCTPFSQRKTCPDDR